MTAWVLSTLSAVLVVAALLLLVPVLVLALQVVCAVAGHRRAEAPASGVRPRLAVLVPAHNEAAGIAAALATMTAQLQPGDRLLVVADNCSDDTARVAAVAGAEVAERHDLQRRGKGYALDHGVRCLEADAPEVVIVIDADCDVGSGALDRLARECALHARPIQALYLMRSPAGAGLKTRIAELACTVKNHVRPLGFAWLGLPCQLMGTGMAFPWRLVREAPLASGHIVEDMQLGIDLAAAGAPPRFCPEAQVFSRFPSDHGALATQRTRWEHGHLSVIASHAPRLLWRALAQWRPALLAMVMDLCVPPLAALVLLIVAACLVGAALALAGGSTQPLVLAGLGLALLTASVLLAWGRFGRHIVSLGELLGAPLYALGKIAIYAKLLTGKQIEWVRTKRDDKRK